MDRRRSITSNAFGGTYIVTLTVEGPAGTGETTVEVDVSEAVLSYADDFERADGAVGGWTIATGGTWAIEGGELTAGPTAEEYFIWAGNNPVVTTANATFEFDWRFDAPGSVGAVGRHGGFQFHCSQPTTRGQFSGYFLDWIDRPSDRGVRFTRCDNGNCGAILVPGQGDAAPAEPPSHYRVVVDGANIRIYINGEDEPIIDVVDNTHRGGYFGFWSWTGDQEFAVDNLTVEADPLSACFEPSTDLVFSGETVGFDASCSGVALDLATIDSYEWDFGDGSEPATGCAGRSRLRSCRHVHRDFDGD